MLTVSSARDEEGEHRTSGRKNTKGRYHGAMSAIKLFRGTTSLVMFQFPTIDTVLVDFASRALM